MFLAFKRQIKAKLWADTNTVKMVFVNNDELTESFLQQIECRWSRQATPIIVEELDDDEAIKFLTAGRFMEQV